MIRRSSRSSRSANIPRADASVDVVISNCVINLSADKYKVLEHRRRQELAVEAVHVRARRDVLQVGDEQLTAGST